MIITTHFRQFEGKDVELIYEEVSKKVFFRLEDVARVAGFAKVDSLRYHTRKKVREVKIGNALYLKVRALNKVAKAATKTPGMARFSAWAQGIASRIIQYHEKRESQPQGNVVDNAFANQILTKKSDVVASIVIKKLYTITEVAEAIGMTVKELSDWLVDEGYASRYVSNNSVYFQSWFKDRGYGTYPKIVDAKGSRTSRVPKITQSGFEYIKARIESQRATNVLSFAKKENFDVAKAERDKLEGELDGLILDTFQDSVMNYKYDALLGAGTREYKLTKEQLLKKVKAILAEVKLKELQ